MGRHQWGFAPEDAYYIPEGTCCECDQLHGLTGAARKEVLELRAYRDKAAAALAAAEQRIEDLTKDLAKHQLAGDGPQADDARSTMSGQAGSFTTEGPSEPATPQRQTQVHSLVSKALTDCKTY